VTKTPSRHPRIVAIAMAIRLMMRWSTTHPTTMSGWRQMNWYASNMSYAPRFAKVSMKKAVALTLLYVVFTY
jgi:hypothetical protein